MADPLAPGAVIDHYRIVSRIGGGGMGEVYLAHDIGLGREVALKILACDDDANRTSRFVQEAQLASTLSHPNIAYIHELGDAGGLRFLAMEYIEGQTLAEKVANGPLHVDEIVPVGIQIADALDAAHCKGIIHRDIKCANIMVTPRGQVKVLDFGLAKVAAGANARPETQMVTTAGMILGTVAYMSPEQATGRDVDQRTDIFSLGVVLYEMATGRQPFSGATPQETIARLLKDQPDAVARFQFGLPEDLDRIIRKCLEKDRERRYPSARDLLVDLRGIERGARPAQAPAAERIRAVIVDDEDLARGLLREYLSSSADVEIVAECANGFEAVKAIGEHKPNLVFLDVQMPKLDGFEVLELIGRDIPVIFVTAYDNHAMRAFDAHAVDYLLKPFGLDRFQTALERARQRLGRPMPPPVELAAAARPAQQYLQRIVVRDGTRVNIVPVAQLDYAEAQDDYVELHSQRKSYLKQQTIASLEAGLDPRQFVRIHRSAIVNIERVTKIEPYTKDSRIAVLTDGTQLPVSRAGYERLKALLDERG